jgi:hypothetical protein
MPSSHFRFLIGAGGGTRRCLGTSQLLLMRLHGVRGSDMTSSESAADRDELGRLERSDRPEGPCKCMSQLEAVYQVVELNNHRHVNDE